MEVVWDLDKPWHEFPLNLTKGCLCSIIPMAIVTYQLEFLDVVVAALWIVVVPVTLVSALIPLF